MMMESNRNYRHADGDSSETARARLRSKPFLFLAIATAMLFGLTNIVFIENESDYFDGRRILSSAEEEGADDNEVVNPEEGPTLVFIMGIEGTGHHMLSSLLEHSPNMKTAHDLGMCKELNNMNTLFFDPAPHKHKRASSTKGMFNPRSGVRSFSADVIYDNAVSNMVTIRHKFKKWRQEQTKEEVESEDASSVKKPFNIAINANSCNGDSQLSYPDFAGQDRSLQNFNLDVFYEMCTSAKVKCSHLYIYRDPYDVLKSTTYNRKFNRVINDGIRLYTSVMQQVHSQMISHMYELAGCFGPLDPEGATKQRDWEDFGAMFGWNVGENEQVEENEEELKSLASFAAAVQEINSKGVPKPMEESLKKKIVPKNLGPMMKAYEVVHSRVVAQCYNTLVARDYIDVMAKQKAASNSESNLLEQGDEEKRSSAVIDIKSLLRKVVS